MSVSDALKKALYAPETEEAFLALLTIDHPELPTPLRVTSDNVSTYTDPAEGRVNNLQMVADSLPLYNNWHLPRTRQECLDKSSNANNIIPNQDNASLTPQALLDGGALLLAAPEGSASDNVQAYAPHISAYNTTDYTVEFWFCLVGRGDPNRSVKQLIHKGTTAADRLFLFYYSTSNESITFSTTDGAGGQDRQILQNMVLGRKYHIAVTRQGTTHRAYIDGAPSPVTPVWTVNNPITTQTSDIMFMPVAETWFLVDEFRFWDIARTEQEIDDNKDGSITPTSNVLGYWGFDDHVDYAYLTGREELTAVEGLVDSGDYSQALYFPGNTISAYASIDYQCLSGKTSFTVEFMFIPLRHDPPGVQEYILDAYGLSTAQHFAVTHLEGTTNPNLNYIRVYALGSFVTLQVTSGIDMYDGSAHRVSITRNGTTGETKLFMDGVHQQTLTGAVGALDIDPGGFLISQRQVLGAGQPGSIGETYRGTIDDVRFFDSILADQTISDNWALPTDPDWTDLDSAYSFDDVQSAAVLHYDAKIANGKIEAGIQFADNSPNYGAAITSGTYSFDGWQSFTLETWVWIPADTSRDAAAGKLFSNVRTIGTLNPDIYGWHLTYDYLTESFRFVRIAALENRKFAFAFNKPKNKWYHVAAVYDGAAYTMKIYINGELEDTEADVDAYNLPVPENLYMGTEAVGVESLVGTMDEVRIWNVARTQQEIQDNMNSVLPNGAYPNNLEGYWNADDSYVEWIPYPFDLILPTDTDENPPEARLAIDNVDRQIVTTLRQVAETPSVQIQVVKVSNTNVVELDIRDFKLKDPEYDVTEVSAALSLEDFLAEPFPAGTFAPSSFPGGF